MNWLEECALIYEVMGSSLEFGNLFFIFLEKRKKIFLCVYICIYIQIVSIYVDIRILFIPIPSNKTTQIQLYFTFHYYITN